MVDVKILESLPAIDQPAPRPVLKWITFGINSVTALAMLFVQTQLAYILVMVAMFNRGDLFTKAILMFVSPLVACGICVPIACKLSRRQNWLCIPIALVPLLVCGGFLYFLSLPVDGSR